MNALLLGRKGIYMYEGYDKEEMILVDPVYNIGGFLLYINSTHPKCPPMPKGGGYNFRTGEDTTLKDFYVKHEYLHGIDYHS